MKSTSVKMPSPKPRNTPRKPRKSAYTVALGERLCLAISNGSSMRKAAEDEGINFSTVIGWTHKHPTFAERYARACEARLCALEDKILELTERGHQVAMTPETGNAQLSAVKLEIDTIKWFLCKLLPKRFGDRQTVAMEGGDKPLAVSHTIPPEALAGIASTLKEIWQEED